MTNPKKDKKEKKDPFKKGKKLGKRKMFFRRERVSFLSRPCKFWSVHTSIGDTQTRLLNPTAFHALLSQN